jgi:muramoyltetrapeptide carboxypeptidase
MSTTLTLWSPAAAVGRAAALTRAVQRLQALGHAVQVDADARAHHQGWAGTDAQRLAALHRVAVAAPGIAMATRGGDGLTRLLDGVDWRLLARSVERGTRWVGRGELTALQLALLAHTGAGSWAGPMACDDFGRADADGGVDDITRDCFTEALDGSLEAVGFGTTTGFDGLAVRGLLWGGNLTALLSLLGTPHWPSRAASGGVLFLEDTHETPERVERALWQLRQAGVLQRQRAVLVGRFSSDRLASPGRRPGLRAAVARVSEGLKVPLLAGLPFGSLRSTLTLPVGRRVDLAVEGREVLISW